MNIESGNFESLSTRQLLHKTKGIILRTVKYGETSLIATVYTELFGLQSYIVKGVRLSSKKGNSKVNMFQPAAVLDMVVYHNELKQLQFIKDYSWAHIPQHLHQDVIKNCVALFIVELVGKSIKQPESNAALFYFMENYLLMLDAADSAVTGNLPLHFALHLARELGFGMEDRDDENKIILDLDEGRFTEQIPAHGNYLDGRLAGATADLLQMDNAVSLYRIKLNKSLRQQLLQAYEQFYVYHVSDFGTLKTVAVLEAVLG
ncbi:MAG: DNA repair protein RecO [Chitinophagaceae bacterium]